MSTWQRTLSASERRGRGWRTVEALDLVHLDALTDEEVGTVRAVELDGLLVQCRKEERGWTLCTRAGVPSSWLAKWPSARRARRGG